MSWDRQKRGLHQRKQGKPQIKKHKPLKSEGNDGDFSIRQLKDGVFLFFKALGTWYKTLNTSGKVIPEIPGGTQLGDPNIPIGDVYVGGNSVHFGDTKSEQGKLGLSSDKTNLVFKNKDGTSLTLFTSAGGALTGDITITDTTRPQLQLLYDATNYARFGVTSSGDLEIETVGAGTIDSDITLDADGDIILEAAGGNVNMDSVLTITSTSTQLGILYDGSNYATLGVSSNGSLEIDTVAHLTLDAAGDIILEAGGGDITMDADVTMAATKKLYLGGDTATAIHEYSDGQIAFDIATTERPLQLNSSTVDGVLISGVWFRSGYAGFTRQEFNYSETLIKATSGTHDTDIDFRQSNKCRLEMTGDIQDVNLIFPGVSGNFLLVCVTSGDHDVTNWKVWTVDESAPTATDVLWAGGSVPAFTDTGTDIVSFYWDATEQEAYGTASLAFAAP